MNVQSEDVRNIREERTSFWGRNTFMELFTQKILAQHIYEIEVVF